MVIPVGFGQVNLMFSGPAVPNGAEVTFGIANAMGKTALEVAQAVETAVDDSNIIQVLTSAVVVTNIHVKLGPDDVGPTADLATSIAGTNSSTAVTPNVSILIRKLTAIGGRAGRGRMFLPGLREGDVDVGGQIDGAFLTSLLLVWFNFGVKLFAADVPAVLLHGEDSPVTTPTVITSFVPDALAATQRRRLRG